MMGTRWRFHTSDKIGVLLWALYPNRRQLASSLGSIEYTPEVAQR